MSSLRRQQDSQLKDDTGGMDPIDSVSAAPALGVASRDRRAGGRAVTAWAHQNSATLRQFARSPTSPPTPIR